jgi:hypothetical protein
VRRILLSERSHQSNAVVNPDEDLERKVPMRYSYASRCEGCIMFLRLLVFTALCTCLPVTRSVAQTAPALLQNMTGTWNVEQKMWPGSGAAAVQLPPGVAQRHLIDGKYLEESMQSSTLTQGQPGFFVRNAILN